MKKALVIFGFLIKFTFSNAQDKPFFEEEVSYWNLKDSIKIGGTLTLPKLGKNFKAVILISGSGAQDRDGTLFGHTIYKNIAEYLTNNGIAVLRLDDRGIGKTTGKTSESTSANFANDVEAGVEFLKKRKEINHNKIGLIGHSEGGMIAPIVASHSKDVAFIVSMAGPGLECADILLSQFFNQTFKAVKDSIKTNEILAYTYVPLFDAIKKNEGDSVIVSNLLAKLNAYEAKSPDDYKKFVHGEKRVVAETLLKQFQSTWFQYFIGYKPAEKWSKITCPVLAINGDKDVQVNAVSNLSVIESSLLKAKNKDFKIIKLKNHNHLFQICKTGEGVEYSQKTDTPSIETLQILAEWLQKL